MRKRRHSRNKDESRMCENGFLSFYILVVEKGRYVLIQSYMTLHRRIVQHHLIEMTAKLF